MTEPLKLRILESDRLVFEVTLTAPVELGRQRAGEPAPYVLRPARDGPARLVLAHAQESNCSRQHLLLEPLADGRVRVTNRSQVPLILHKPHPDIPPSTALDLAPPFGVVLEHRTIAVAPSDSVDEHGVQGLEGHTVAPGSLSDLSKQLRPLPSVPLANLDEILGWLQTTMGVLQSAVGSADFLAKAAEALVQIVGLHSGRVLLLEGDVWQIEAFCGTVAEPGSAWQPSKHVLERVRQEKRTLWQRPQQATVDTPSLQSLQTVVASPLLDAAGNVIGALYGERQRSDAAPQPSGGKLEAILVDLLACGVSTGLARKEQESAAVKARVQFEQFFTPQLAEHLRREPDLLLHGREAEVTLLFCDIRGFSRVSEKLGPAGTVRWIGDVMGELSDRVLTYEGVLVDYIGDEMLAMWGAPLPQEDQAIRAVSAALAMRASLPVLNAHWSETLGEDMALGIGINTGQARVGNTGSRFKFKYGPLGNTVNLASRVQGLTKYLKCQMLVTAATRAQLDERFIARRVCKARVVNIKEPVDLYEVEEATTPERGAFFGISEGALDALERGDFALAARLSGYELENHAGDGPLLLVLSRAAHMLMHGGVFDPVWEPPGK
jgi:adenylate cyclase